MASAEQSVSKAVTVDVGASRAFEVFTEGMDTWWNRGHHIGTVDVSRFVLEPGVGGRWFEVGVDGSETEWGKVLVWEPPTRLVLCWQIGSGWQFEPSLETEVEVRFIEEGPERTRVELEHRNLDRYGDDMEQMRSGFDSPGGWQGLLSLYAAAANR